MILHPLCPLRVAFCHPPPHQVKIDVPVHALPCTAGSIDFPKSGKFVMVICSSWVMVAVKVS